MYSFYGHPRYFKFKRKYQQYDLCFQIFPFLVTMIQLLKLKITKSLKLDILASLTKLATFYKNDRPESLAYFKIYYVSRIICFKHFLSQCLFRSFRFPENFVSPKSWVLHKNYMPISFFEEIINSLQVNISSSFL